MADQSPGYRPEWDLAMTFLRQHGPASCRLFTLARWACIPFSLLGGFIACRWAYDLWGPWAGLLSLVLWCSDPNILAHGQFLTPDLAASAFGLATGYAFWRWLQQPGSATTVALGLSLGLAELTKTTWLVLYPTLAVAWLLTACGSHGASRTASRWKEARRLTVAFLLSLVVLNAGYGFDGTFTPLGEFNFVSASLTGENPTAQAHYDNRFRHSWLAELPVPFPADYVLGIDTQKREFELQPPGYLHGNWRRGGWWYYYLYGLAIKVPLGTWALILVATVWGLRHGMPAGQRGAAAALLLPAAAVLALVSSQTGINSHVRYALPALPFLFVWAGQAALFLTPGPLAVGALVVGALCWSIASSLSVYPHSLSYFNELAGGPLAGHNHLLESNMDWGQDYLFLKKWQDCHPEAAPFRVLTFGYDPRLIGVRSEGRPPLGPRSGATPPPEQVSALGPQTGWYAVGVTYLHADDRDLKLNGPPGPDYLSYEYFRRFRPVARAGYSVYIYHIRLQDANQVRRDLGLPALPDFSVGAGHPTDRAGSLP